MRSVRVAYCRVTTLHWWRLYQAPKDNISHSLRRLEAQGLIVLVRTPGGQKESLSLISEGRQKAS
jgi:hypothetical protein